MDKSKIDSTIERILLFQVSSKFHRIVKYQIATGGKRLRPILAITSCQMLGGKLDNVLAAAAGLEILHNYTLIVDDVIDHSTKRRNQPTLWAKYGHSMAQCVAVDYSASIFQAALHCPCPNEISALFTQTIKRIIEGEITDILFERTGRTDEPYIIKNRYRKITENDYIKMASQKTASLFEAGCEIGGICAKGSKKQIRALKNYGFNLGIAFQIKDDVLDIFGKEKQFGKKIGHDIIERKGGNIVLLYAMEELKNKEKQKILTIMKKSKITQKDIRQVITLIQKTKAREKALQLAKKFIKKAKSNLKSLPQNKHNKTLGTLVDLVIERSK